MKLWHLLVGWFLACAVGLVLAYFALIGIAYLYHAGDPLIRSWFG